MSTCKKYKSCDHVPCNATMNRCRPHYCFPESSRNWGYCNMANWKGKNYKKYKSYCKDETKCKYTKTKKTKHTVDAMILHNKMPYIWRFLKPNTRKIMIDLANKPVKTINIPFHIYPGKTIKNKRQIKQIVKNMTKSNRKRFYKLRRKYKDV